MNSTLKEVISEKCRKKVISLESYSENEGEVEEMEEKESGIVEELPFEDILADKRRKYSAKEEFIFLLYNDTLQYFVKEWDGTYLRKKPTKILVDDSRNSSNDDEDIGERQDYEDVNESKESDNNSEEFNNDTNKSSFVSSWKLSLPDEFANIRFISNNTYSGRISRKMMEGEGVYKWSNGARYKGEFEQNLMHGKGLLEWNNVCWYEGDFSYGYRHGRGIMVDGENRYMYTGQWHMGQRHGKGYSRYSDNGSYDGDWVMNKMNGIGLRIYPSGGRYVGQWKNGVRDGIGTMVWPNGSLYRGEWKCGAMHGYGEYVWNGFFNKTFAWPQEASYVGYWRRGMRHGKGEIKLNSVGGAKYSGYWKDNKKHGYGVIIANLENSNHKATTKKVFELWRFYFVYEEERFNIRNGTNKFCAKVDILRIVEDVKTQVLEDTYTIFIYGFHKEAEGNEQNCYASYRGSNGHKFEANPLFSNDILCAPNIVADNLETETKTKDEGECVQTEKEIKPAFAEKPGQLVETWPTPILKPEQFLCLSYYITRLLDPKNMEPSVVLSASSGKCYSCERESCSCLAHPLSIDTITSERNDITQTHASESYSENMIESVWKYEECWTYNCLTFHMLRLREIYNDYATLFAKSAPKCNLAMSRLCLWQLWRDCGIHKKGLSLTEIDSYIAKNETTMVKDPLHPFEKIEIWQFLHALLEVSWHLYTKHNDDKVEEMNGKIAGGLHKFLKNYIYPHVGNHVGTLCRENQDLLPIYCVFELYQQIGYPISAKDLLRATCVLKHRADSKLSSTTAEAVENFPDGINSVTIGEKVSYLLKLDEIFSSPDCTINISRRYANNLCSTNGLLVFTQLGTRKMIEIMMLICPGIKDANSGVIINMDYKLTFLEFYEIILEAAKELLSLRKKTLKMLHTKNIEEETLSLKANNLRKRDGSRINEMSPIKISKTKKEP